MSPESAGEDDRDERTADEPLLRLPDTVRTELKTPIGPIETDAETLLDSVSGPLITVGDVVTYHVLEAGRSPDVAVVDGFTERTAVETEIKRTVTATQDITVENPPATITEALIVALCQGLEDGESTTIFVDGEEDLATLPAIIAAPDGASVVYGQPGEGMAHVVVDTAVRERIWELLGQFHGDQERLAVLLGDQ